ncbi:MAG: hypothetical protein KDB27_14795 [Planctomycetales bacterium]|nr:hypothetical protein [Planctomycetales bacterium]
MNISRSIPRIVFGLLFAVASQAFAITDSFETYSIGNIDGQGDWIDFGGTLLTEVSTDQARTGTQSLKQTLNDVDPNPFDIPGYGSDVYQDLPSVHTSGVWDLSYWVYVPANFDGASILHLADNQVAGGDDLGFGLQLVVDGSATFNEFLASQDGSTGTGVSLIRDQWVEVTASIDLDANTVLATYNGSSIFSGTWDPGTDPASLGGLNLWVQGGEGNGSIYYDDFSLVPEPTNAMLAACGLLAMLAIRRRK